MKKIFVSYRRIDSSYIAATINEKLKQNFGSDAVYFDIDNIPLGTDFRKNISDAVGECDILLALIGDEWVSAADEQGNPRLFDPYDTVRIEIESALARNIPVIPVLVGEAKMPKITEIPSSLQDLSFRNAAEVRAGHDLDQHLSRLISGIKSILDPEESKKKQIILQTSPEEDTVPKKKVILHAPETEHNVTEPSQDQEIERGEVHKKPFWTSLLGIMTSFVIIIAIVIGLYFAYIYSDQEGHVCYDKKIEGDNGEVFYKGCKIYETDCTTNRKEHFGKYPNMVDTEAAYARCINGTPRPVIVIPIDEQIIEPKEQIEKEKVISFSENGITMHVTYPSHVRVGQKFTVTAEMTNNNSSAKQGGLTLSFPDMKSIPVRLGNHNFSTFKKYDFPQKIWNETAKKPLTAKYFMLEGWQNQLWRKGRRKSFSVELTPPNGLDELKVNLRGILWIKNSKDTRKIPLSSHIYDQQGYPVKQFSIKIKR